MCFLESYSNCLRRDFCYLEDVDLAILRMASGSLRHTAKQLISKNKKFSIPMVCRLKSTTAEKNILSSPYKEMPTTNDTVTDFVWHNLDKWPDKTATVCAVTGHGYTYEQTYKMSVAFAASLRTKLKLQNGDNVAISLPNSPEYPCTVFGILKAGGVACLLNPVYTAPTVQTVTPAILPFFHIFGFNALMLAHLYKGCKLVTTPYFKPDLFTNILLNHRPDVLYVVPPMVVFLGKSPSITPEHVKSVENVICGAAPISYDDAAVFVTKNKNVIFRQGYGLTETNGGISVATNTDSNYGSVGYPLPSCEVKIADLNTQEALGSNKEGEIWFRGPNLMEGYYKNEVATKETMTEDGWYKTGDIGRYDENQYLYVTDRLKELIKVKGFQVPPAELEAILRTHPKVFDCAVLGIPDPVTGEAPKAFIVTPPGGQPISTEEIKDFVNKKVASFKRIKDIQIVDAIPKTSSGKVSRKDIKTKYC